MFASKNKTIAKKVKKLKPLFLNTFKYYNYLDNLGHQRVNNDNTYRPNTISQINYSLSNSNTYN